MPSWPSDSALFMRRPAAAASGLRVPQAVADFLMLRVIRESKGTALGVSDQEMVAEIDRVGSWRVSSSVPRGEQGWLLCAG